MMGTRAGSRHATDATRVSHVPLVRSARSAGRNTNVPSPPDTAATSVALKSMPGPMPT